MIIFNKLDKLQKNYYEKIIPKQGKLKKGLKYRKDFIVVCGQLYQVLKTNYNQDYIIKFTKLETLINLNKNNKKEKDEDKKEAIKNEIKDEKKERENAIKEKDQEYINKEKMVKEKLDKFILDENQGFISKLIKINEQDNLYVLYELDFYPVQIYEKSFGEMVRIVEKAKKLYDRYNEIKNFVLLPEKEQNKINKEKEKEKEKKQKRIYKFQEEMKKNDSKRLNEQISAEDYDMKRKELIHKYEDI